MPDINVLTFNARGIRNVTKRRSLFRFLHQWYPKHIVVLQETHSSQRDVAIWQAEWGAPIMMSHGRTTSECGVAILLPRALIGVCDANVVFSDDDGRLIIIEVGCSTFKLLLCAVYAPTQGHGMQQVEFLKKVRVELEAAMNGDPDILMCGDFNLHLSKLDTQNRFRMTQAARELVAISGEWNLVDVWRDKYKDKRQYTWRRFNPNQQSRIDYILASEHLMHNNVLKRIEIRPGINSDHSIVNLELTVCYGDRGRGLFRFDNALLEDTEFVENARAEIEKANQCQGIYEHVTDCGLKIEMLSSEIRAQSIKIASWRARQRKQKEHGLIERLGRLEQEIGISMTDEKVQEYLEIKNELEQEEEKRGRAAMLRSGARWLELGEKPTKYFLRLNAGRKKEKDINVLQREDGEHVTGNRDILRYCCDHYEKMYSSQAGGTEGTAQVVNLSSTDVCPRLSQSDQERCEGPISNQECEQALKEMKNNKAASVSGLTKEFFLFFWEDLGGLIVDYINEAKQKGVFFVTQRRGVITVLPKKGDQMFIKNKRAICLLDIIYKIVAKVIANRLRSVIHLLIDSDQTGSIAGRYIGANLRTIADVIHYCDADEREGILMALDFKNAFNTVEHEFLYGVLREFNFGENFIGWVQLLHKSTELTVVNNGFTSRWFKTSRGLQQGCPASAPLFALVVEILAIKIRASILVEGIELSGTIFKISQYCDDTTLFVKDSTSAERVIDIVRDFGKDSGLQLNMDKSDFMWLGPKRRSGEEICGREPVDKIKILGVWFSANENCNRINTEAVEGKIRKTVDNWKQRDLTLKGKITVVKALLTSQLVYLFASDSIDEKVLNAIQSHIMKYVWRGRPPKVAKRTMILPVEKGGLNLPDVMNIYKANRISWMGRLVQLRENSFVKVLQKRLRVSVFDMGKMKLDEEWINHRQIPVFYKKMLKWFMALEITKEPETGQAVREQPMWHNNFINVRGKSLVSSERVEKRVPLVDDFIGREGKVLSYETFTEQNEGLLLNALTYIGYCRAIPPTWKRLVTSTDRLSASEKVPTLIVKNRGRIERCINAS